jgi:hypothetical protein
MDARIPGLYQVLTTRASRFASRPGLYITIILCTMLVAYTYRLRTNGIFGCEANGYTLDRYLSFCPLTGYGDYEHGAFLFRLEPSAWSFTSNADVLFLGDSHVQHAFSTVATTQWFKSASARYYLLGFIIGENVRFTEPLLQKIKPTAKVYVLPVDFFARNETFGTREVLNDSAAPFRYQEKRVWQFVHKTTCSVLPAACGIWPAIFRSRETGSFYVDLNGAGAKRMFKGSPVVYDHDINQERIAKYTTSARDFLSGLAVARDCIILTRVPTVRANAFVYASSIETAGAVANALRLTLVAPELDGLQTFDGSHLDPSSAERWSQAFFEAAGPQIRKCLSPSNVQLQTRVPTIPPSQQKISVADRP